MRDDGNCCMRMEGGRGGAAVWKEKGTASSLGCSFDCSFLVVPTRPSSLLLDFVGICFCCLRLDMNLLLDMYLLLGLDLNLLLDNMLSILCKKSVK